MADYLRTLMQAQALGQTVRPEKPALRTSSDRPGVAPRKVRNAWLVARRPRQSFSPANWRRGG